MKTTIRLTEASLNTVGMTIMDRERVLLRCLKCHMTFSPMPHREARKPVGWWKCPNGCNDKALSQRKKKSA